MPGTYSSKGNLEFPDFDVGVGRSFCLHIPYDFQGEVTELKLTLANTVKQKGGKVVVSYPAYDSRWFRILRKVNAWNNRAALRAPMCWS